MKEYTLSVSSFPHKFDQVLEELAKGSKIMLTHKKNLIGEFVLRPNYDLRTDGNVENTPDVLEKTIETAQTLKQKNPPYDTTNAKTHIEKHSLFDPSGGYSEEKARATNQKIAELLAKKNEEMSKKAN